MGRSCGSPVCGAETDFRHGRIKEWLTPFSGVFFPLSSVFVGSDAGQRVAIGVGGRGGVHLVVG